ncbi:MFS transporter [Sphingomonas sp. SUN039]|uniref:MFS transporter n=1 Tax=Sphingomonas sp. SUN039 TaxID=2937787 RepID=UPI00216443CF|nr:glycoside-pentoside-hexuronide (GPH):cation symporter [Sphingomonas sp. SUN039]UVO53099.1 glycoside-pentoside-hexuronide (GPH):cation symporter [Sphingomonas sp. SUN039]
MNAARLSLKERLSYGFGDLGFSLPYNMASGFLLYYYVSIVKLPAVSVGTIFLIARLMDAVIDMLVGIAVDKTRSRWGRTRGYILFMALPYALLFVAVFSVPDWGQNAQLVYAFLTFKGLGILMSLGSIPYTALMPMMTDNQDDRLKLSGARSIGTSVSVVLGTAATTPLVGLFGGGDERRGFLAVAILFGGISLIALTALFRNCKERIEDNASPRYPILPAVGEMLRNRAWLVAFGFCLIYFVRFGGMMATTPYFAIDVLGKPWMISVMMPAIAGMLLLSSFIAPPFYARFGLRNGCIAVLGAAALLFMALPFCEGNAELFLGVYIAACLATSITITAAFTMIAATVDFHEAQFGTRKEGLLSAGVSLATKVGMALGTAGIAFMLGAVDYAPQAVTGTAREAIRWSYYGGTVVLLGLQVLVVMFWPMNDRKDAA